ncbi:hypothetical protein M408DRAFT_28149 [Serendipita vermifera MAFF 305830]|uniref:C2H2-type domain-containing protein n=1 Tax=Serendipita vermifera MAFF 305830 TaxID=933852 RepID=A0A0C3AT12_SERVB|nr:hypothetical protein M408DRAFT_28149 [Serendipita vermifera MAFF 305830]
MPARKTNHFCSRCCKSFARAANLRRHQQERKTVCDIDERVGKLLVEDPQTGRRRYESKEERVTRIRRRKREYYCRNVRRLRERACRAAHQRRGHRQGSMPKEERERKNKIMWRRIIRAVYWRDTSEKRILALATQLARKHNPGDKDVPAWVKGMYKSMKKIFAGRPEYWDALRNTWNEEYFDYQSSEGDPFSDLERIYAASELEDEEDEDDYW